MLSPVYGTDLMVVLATKAINTTSHTHSVASLLGHDSHRWGFSYQGFVQHGGKKVAYASRWTVGQWGHCTMTHGEAQCSGILPG